MHHSLSLNSFKCFKNFWNLKTHLVLVRALWLVMPRIRKQDLSWIPDQALSSSSCGNTVVRLCPRLRGDLPRPVFQDVHEKDEILRQQLKERAKSAKTIVDNVWGKWIKCEKSLDPNSRYGDGSCKKLPYYKKNLYVNLVSTTAGDFGVTFHVRIVLEMPSFY